MFKIVHGSVGRLALSRALGGGIREGSDLKTEGGRAVLYRLLESADVFLTNFLPSVLERLGLGVDELRTINPHLIYARGHGYGGRVPEVAGVGAHRSAHGVSHGGSHRQVHGVVDVRAAARRARAPARTHARPRRAGDARGHRVADDRRRPGLGGYAEVMLTRSLASR